MRVLLTLLIALALPVLAHEGHDHGAPALATPVSAGAPRATAQSPDLEAVAVLDGSKLTIHLDRYASNEPLVDAAVEIESGALKATAARVAPGVYVAVAPQLDQPGRHALTLVVLAGDVSDLLSLTLDVPAAPLAAPLARLAWGGWLGWAGAAAAALLAGLGLRAVVRRRRQGVVAGSVAGSAAAALLVGVWLLAAAPGAAVAHGGEDHSQDGKKPAAAEAGPAAAMSGEAGAARRLPDGSVFMPKAMQYQLGLRHLVAQPGEHPATIEFSARVVADLQSSGRVQATQPGRIEVGTKGLPTIGQRVLKGELLATLRPSTGAIERGNQQALRAELEAQRAIAEQRLARLEQLDGAVPRKDVDAARVEAGALRQRIEAISGALAATEALVAPVSGVVSAVHVLAGQVVEAREVLIEVVDPARLAVEALAYEPMGPKDLASASATVAGRDLPLVFIGAGRQLREQAMPLLFALRSPEAMLAVGQPLKVIARTTRRVPGVAVPRSAVVRLASGEPGVWVHVAAERFVQRRVSVQALDGATLLVTAGVEKGERIATEGASLLAQVR